jgi:hypothetical protein
MALPKLSIPQYAATLPSTGEEILYRAFMVREEKILLMAAESKDIKSMSLAIKQVLQNCIITDGIRLEKLPYFDVEYLFLQVRARSIGETVKLAFKHVDGLTRSGESCSCTTEVELNLDRVSAPAVSAASHLLAISPTMTMDLRYPTLDEIILVTPDAGKSLDPTKVFELIAGCLVRVIEGDDVHMPDSKKEAAAFIESLPHTMMEKINTFFETIPTITQDVTYTCEACDQTDTITLRGLKDFF